MKKDDQVKVSSINEKLDFIDGKIGTIKEIVNSLYKGQVIYKVLFDKIGHLYIRKEYLIVL